EVLSEEEQKTPLREEQKIPLQEKIKLKEKLKEKFKEIGKEKAKERIKKELDTCTKICRDYENHNPEHLRRVQKDFQKQHQEKKISQEDYEKIRKENYIKACKERALLHAKRALLHLDSPFKQYNFEMLQDAYERYRQQQKNAEAIKIKYFTERGISEAG